MTTSTASRAGAPRRLGSRIPGGFLQGSRARRTLFLLTLATAALAVVQGLVTMIVGLQVRSRLLTITHDLAPSIIAAQDLRSRIQKMDANLANDVLVNGTLLPQINGYWVANRSASGKDALEAIGRAQANVTIPGECQAIDRMRNGLVDYTSLAA